jgi:hypothetical protein
MRRAAQILDAGNLIGARIGPPDGRATGVRFYRKAKLDVPAIVWEHHPRCTYED